MKRPVVIFMLALILGEFIAVIGGHITVFVMIVPVLLMYKIITKKWSIILVMIFLFCMSGFCVTMQEKEKADLAYSLEETGVDVVGDYKNVEETSYGIRYYLKNVDMVYKDKKIHFRELLVYSDENPNLKSGNRVWVSGKLQQFHQARNYGNFDSRNYYKSLGIYVSVKQKEVSVCDNDYRFFRNEMHRLRNDLIQTIQLICHNNHHGIFKICDEKKGGILCAVILGDKSNLSKEVKNIYQVSGVSHLLAISGLHIATIGIFVFKLLRKRFKFVLSGSVSMAIVLGFVFMSGAGISSVRACGMFIFYLFSQMLGRKYDMLNAMSFVVIIVCFDNPFILLNSAFQMSFGAVLTIVIVNPIIGGYLGLNHKRKIVKEQIKKKKYLRERMKLRVKNTMIGVAQSLICSISINIVLMPIVAFNYFEISFYSIFLNIIVIPFMAVVIGSAIVSSFGFLVASMILGNIIGISFLLQAAKVIIMPGCVVLSFYEHLCRGFSKIPGNVFVTGKPYLNQIFVYYMMVAIFLLWAKWITETRKKAKEKKEQHLPKDGRRVERQTRGKILKKLADQIIKILILLCYIALLISVIIYHDNGRLNMMFDDVGQGDGIVISKDDFVIMIDGGSSDINEVGKYRIIPALKARGIRKVNYAIVTHADMDHISGILEILVEDSPDKVFIENLLLPLAMIRDDNYKKIINAAKEQKTNVKFIGKGDCIKKGELIIKCLHPFDGFETSERNSYSTVLDVTYGKFKMLLTGDISGKEEKNFINELDGAYTVLKVAHHGSKYSTTEQFLEKIKPEFSIISCGIDNHYGHPHKELLERIMNMGSCIIRTDLSGQITIATDGEKMQVERFIN